MLFSIMMSTHAEIIHVYICVHICVTYIYVVHTIKKSASRTEHARTSWYITQSQRKTPGGKFHSHLLILRALCPSGEPAGC